MSIRIRHIALTAAISGALLAAGCSKPAEPAAEPAAPAAEATPAPAPAPAPEATAPAADAAATAPAADATAAAPAAAGCKIDIEANDMMQYNTKAITVAKSCTDFTINLKHAGKMPIAAMGHNVVIAKTSDMAGIAADGVAATVEQSHIKPGDARVIAFSKMIGGGESTSVTFPVSKIAAGGTSFFCTFPGHLALMQGTITVQ